MLASLVSVVIYLLIVGAVCGLLLWVNDAIPIPEPFHNVVRILVLIVGVLVVIMLLLQLAGVETPRLGKLG